MKHFLRDHPILTAVLLGTLITIISVGLSIIKGRHYYYRIYDNGDPITDVEVTQLSDSGTPLNLLKQSSIDYGENFTLVYFDAVSPGEGRLNISYVRHTPDGETINSTRNIRMAVSRMKVIYFGEGIFNRNGISVIHLGISLYSLLMILYFIWRRRILSKMNRYSYEYISTWSGQIFFSGIFLVYTIIAATSIIKLNYIDETLIISVTRYLMMLMTIITIPSVCIFAVAMTISNISLIHHEGKRFNNMLGILTGIGLLGAIFVVMALFILFVLFGTDNTFISVLYFVANSFYIVFFSVLFGAIISGLQAGYYTPSMDKDYILILGCAIKKDGTLFPLIRGRVDRAIDFWKAQEAQTGKKAVFVPSGGKGSDEIISEGEAMKRYLLEQGIPEEYIMAETNSTTTYENMKFSRKLIESINPSARVAFSTTNYHVMRSGILAAKAGLRIEGMGAPTKWYFWPNALLREVAGMFAYQPKIQILTMLILALLAGITGYIYCLVF